MPPDQPEKHSGPSKRHRRSRSINMPPSIEVIDLSDTSEPETSSSRKHDRHEMGSQNEGPSKRHKPNRGSEPPMRKDTIMTLKAKRKKSRDKVNHHKASRTSNHKELKHRINTLELELASVRQAHEDTNGEQQEDLDWHAKEVKRLDQQCIKQAEEVREQQHLVENARQDNENLKRKLEDPAHGVEALQRSCQNKDESLRGKDEVITALNKALEKSKAQSASLEKSLAETQVTLKSKDELIAAKQKELDDSNQRSASLKESLAKAKLAIQSKDELIITMQKELDNSNNKSSTLEKSLGEKDRALKAAKRDQSDCHNELALRDEKLSSTELERDQTKEALEKSQNETEALHLVNEEVGHRNYNLRAREKKNKDALKSLKQEHEGKISEFEALKDRKDQMVAKLQRKLNESRQQSQGLDDKEPDEKIRLDFVTLESSIRQFVDKYARPVLNATDEELKTFWPKWSPELRKFLADPLLCNPVLEAYVWEYLLARIFTPGSAVWAGDLGQSLDKTFRLAAEETKHRRFDSDLYIDFQYVRSSSSCLISRLDGPADFRPKYFETDVKTMITKLAKLTEHHESIDTMKIVAMGIFKEAREFEIQLRKLRPEYTLRMHKPVSRTEVHKYGFDFDDKDMDDRSPNRSSKTLEEARSVDFIVYPGLYKRGDVSGANYELTSCVVKMGVVCNTAKLLQKSGSATPARSGSTKAPGSPHTGEQENEGSTSRSQAGSPAKKSKKGSSTSNAVQIQGEEAETQQDFDQMSTPEIASGSSTARARRATQTQSSTAKNMQTRSQAGPKTESYVHDGKPSTKPRKNQAVPMGPAKGRPGGSSTKKGRHRKESEWDEDYRP